MASRPRSVAQQEKEVIANVGITGLGSAVAAETGGELGEIEEIRARGYWELVWRRFRRDKVAIASGVFIVLLIAVAFGGAPVAQHYNGHGPTDLFTTPPAVSIPSLLAANPGTWIQNPYTGKKNILLLGAANRLGQDEFLRLLYGARISLEGAGLPTLGGL